MPAERARQLAHALIFIAPAMWAANYLVARLAPGVIEPHLLALLRWVFALLMMLPFAWAELRAKAGRWQAEWRDLLVLGALGMWICGAFVYIGGRSTSATNIGLLYSITPVLIAVASARLFGDRLRPVQMLGVAVALAGVLFILAQGSFARLLAVQFVVGDLWILIAAICWVVYSLLLRRQPSVLGPFARLTVIAAAGVLVLIPFAAVEVVLLGLPTDWPRALWFSFIVALLPGFGAYQAYSFMQRELGPARTGLVLYLSPLYSAALAWIVLGEAPAWFHAVGAALILPGMYLATSAGPAARLARGLHPPGTADKDVPQARR